MTPARRRHLTRFLRMFMREARWLLRRRQVSNVGPRADRCRNCAFQPGTDSHQGFESTAWNLPRALRDELPFYCHAGMPYVEGSGWVPPADLRRLRPCAGWLSVGEVGPGVRENVLAMLDRARRRAGPCP